MSFYGPCSADRLVLKACEIDTAALLSFAICEVIRCAAFVQLSINLSLGNDSVHKEYWFSFRSFASTVCCLCRDYCGQLHYLQAQCFSCATSVI
jgi:hypothetical protein